MDPGFRRDDGGGIAGEIPSFARSDVSGMTERVAGVTGFAGIVAVGEVLACQAHFLRGAEA